MAAPDFLEIGHLERDLTDGGWRPGGTAIYASLVAARLGLRAAVLTSAAPDINPSALLPDIEVVCLSSPCTTTFDNIYRRGRRRQYVRAVASLIGPDDLPKLWCDSSVVLLGPVIGEVDAALAACFPNSLVGISAQGWLRKLGRDGRVRPANPQSVDPLLPYAHIVFASDEDVEQAIAAPWAKRVPVVVYTQGEAGARLWHQGREQHVPPTPARAVDPTGAGDAFAAAFLIRWRETGDVLESARFASACASLVVEAEGVGGIPTRERIEKRLKQGGA